MHQDYANALQRIRVASSVDGDLSGIADWICQNTADPKDNRKKFSFHEHEYQIDIANETAPNAYVIKPSQVGASELEVRVMLAMASIIRNCTVIYTLPTAAFAKVFAKGRVDPVITNSEALKQGLNKDVDSSTMKQIGGSFIYFGGTYGQQAAISIPAQVLITDEKDFSNPVVLSTYKSRLGHNKNGGYHRSFSTPTVEGFGIAADYADSSQAEYMVKHDACAKWVNLDFFDHVVVPGFDSKLNMFRKDDLKNPRYKWQDAWIRCPECSQVITAANMADPAKRAWVHRAPEHPDKGYRVKPFDVIAYNPPWKTLSYVKDYERHADWVNFKVGLTFEDAENSFVKDRIQKSAVLSAIQAGEGAAAGCVMGVDVGNISHIVIAKRMGRKFKIIYRERVGQTGDNALLTRVKLLKKWFGVRIVVIDIGPDLTVPKQLIAQLPSGHAWAAQYVRQISGSLETYSLDEAEQIASVNRTALIDEVAKAMNGGWIETPLDEFQTLYEEHLRAMKRVTQLNNQGEAMSLWVKTGEDHFAHATFYCWLADMIAGANVTTATSLILPHAHRVQVGANSKGMGIKRSLSGVHR